MKKPIKITAITVMFTLFTIFSGVSPAVAVAPNTPNPDRITAIQANGALWAGLQLPGTGEEVSSVTIEATLDTTASPTVVATCTSSFPATKILQIKRCKLTGLTNGTPYYLRAKLGNSSADSAWVWSDTWGVSTVPLTWTPSATAVTVFGASVDCSFYAESPIPCVNTSVDTVVTMTGQNLQSCTLITKLGATDVSIPVSPAGDGSSITFTAPKEFSTFATFNCGLGTRNNFLVNKIRTLGENLGHSTAPTPTWSQSSGSTSGGDQVTLTASDVDLWYMDAVFSGITSLTLGGNPVTYTVVDLYTLRITIPAGSAGPANLVMVNSNGTGTQAAIYTYVAPVIPGAPGTPTVVAGDGKVTVTVSKGSGGDPASYLVTSSPLGLTCTVTVPATSCDVTGLTNGTPYTFTATATNGAGTSGSSAASLSATPALPPAPGTPGTPTVVAGNALVTVTPVAPSSGGAVATYTVTASPGGATCTVTAPASSCDVTGLTNDTAYTFTTTATNTGGTSSSSAASASATPRPAAPGTPGTPTVVAGNAKVTVTPVAPSSGGPVASYTVTASPGGATCTVIVPATSCDVTPLTNGTAYTFTTTATNSGGTSSPSPGAIATPVLPSSGGSSSTSGAVTWDDKPTAGGSMSVVKNADGSYTLNAVAKDGFVFSSWSCTNSLIATGNPATVRPTSNSKCKALFSKVEKMITSKYASEKATSSKSTKSKIRKFLKKNQSISSFECIGLAKKASIASQNLAKARAEAACAHITKLRPNATVNSKWSQRVKGSHSPKKVTIRGFSEAR